MVVRFLTLATFFVLYANSQNYQSSSNSYSYAPQYGNYLHNTQYPQGAGGSYPNQQQYQQPPSQYSNNQQPVYNNQHGNGQNTQFGARYSTTQVPSSQPAVARGVPQYQPRAQPLPRVFTSSPPNTELAPLATASAPTYAPQPPQNVQQPQTFTGQYSQPQSQQNFFYPPVSNQQPQPPQQFQQQPQIPVQAPPGINPTYYAEYLNATSQQLREPPVTHYTFKEGTPPYYCAYGLPVPQYNTDRKKCIPWHPMCGIVFTCIMDV